MFSSMNSESYTIRLSGSLACHDFCQTDTTLPALSQAAFVPSVVLSLNPKSTPSKERRKAAREAGKERWKRGGVGGDRGKNQ